MERRVFHSLHEIYQFVLQSNGIEGDVIIIPPRADTLTDEDGESEDEYGTQSEDLRDTTPNVKLLSDSKDDIHEIVTLTDKDGESEDKYDIQSEDLRDTTPNEKLLSDSKDDIHEIVTLTDKDGESEDKYDIQSEDLRDTTPNEKLLSGINDYSIEIVSETDSVEPEQNSYCIPRWRKSSPQYDFNKSRGFACDISHSKMKNAISGLSPTEIFEKMFTREVYTLIVEETIRYAKQKNIHSFNLTDKEIKIFVGILLFSGCCWPEETDYWSAGFGFEIVRKAMSRNSFLYLKSLIHFQNNETAKQNKNDRSFKIKPLLDLLNTNFQQWGIFQHCLSVDEMTVRLNGHGTLNEFIKGKPITFGYKLWALCGQNGYCYNFALYCGRTRGENLKKQLVNRVVLDRISLISDPSSYQLYFDKHFASHKLLSTLREKGFRATATIREKHTAKCPKRSMKNQRGHYHFYFDTKNKVLVVRWNDNRPVTVITNFDTVRPLAQVHRWSSAHKKMIKVPQPNVIKNYNIFMGGVDQHDSYLEDHHICVKGKKWYWFLFTRAVDMALVNSYVVYKTTNDDPMPIYNFRMIIARSYMELGHGASVQPGRPV